MKKKDDIDSDELEKSLRDLDPGLEVLIDIRSKLDNLTYNVADLKEDYEHFKTFEDRISSSIDKLEALHGEFRDFKERSTTQRSQLSERIRQLEDIQIGETAIWNRRKSEFGLMVSAIIVVGALATAINVFINQL